MFRALTLRQRETACLSLTEGQCSKRSTLLSVLACSTKWKMVENGEETSMLKEFAKVTLDIISQISFNINVEAIEHPESHFPVAITSYLRGVQANLDIPFGATLLSIFQFRLFQSSEQK